jgi:hypothetical protein
VGLQHQAAQTLGGIDALEVDDVSWRGVRSLGGQRAIFSKGAWSVECRGVEATLGFKPAWPPYEIEQVTMSSCHIERLARQEDAQNDRPQLPPEIEAQRSIAPREITGALRQFRQLATDGRQLFDRMPVPVDRLFIERVSFANEHVPRLEEVELRADGPSGLSGSLRMAKRRLTWQLDVQETLSLRIASTDDASWQGQFGGEPWKLGGGFDATFAMLEEHEDSTRITASFASNDSTIEAAHLASRAVNFPSVRATMEARIETRSGRIEALIEGSWADVPIHADLLARYQGLTYRTTVEIEPPAAIECDKIWASVPAGLAPNLGGELSLAGQWQPRLSLLFVTGDPNSFRLDASGQGGCQVTDTPKQWDPRSLSSDEFLGRIMAERGRIDAADWAPVAVHQVPAYVYRALQVHEDPDFDDHRGVSPRLVAHAVRKNLVATDIVYGGSTLIQQIIKNLYLSTEKTLQRKFEETILSWMAAERVSKERLLSVYMNIAEFGEGIYGVGPAADHYFQKSAARLTPLEAAYLAVLLPWPHRGREHLAAGQSPEDRWWTQRILSVLSRLEMDGHLDAPTVDAAAPYVVRFPNALESKRPEEF